MFDMRSMLFYLLPMLLVACGESTSSDTPVSDTAEKAAPTKMVSKKLSPLQFKELLAKTPDAQLVDVRTPAEYESGTIQGAINVDIKAPNFSERIEKLDKGRPVFLFCKVGGRSAKASQQLQDMGFTTLYDLSEGYLGWQEMQTQPQLQLEPVEE